MRKSEILKNIHHRVEIYVCVYNIDNIDTYPVPLNKYNINSVSSFHRSIRNIRNIFRVFEFEFEFEYSKLRSSIIRIFDSKHQIIIKFQSFK